jgi:hypothetical protein
MQGVFAYAGTPPFATDNSAPTSCVLAAPFFCQTITSKGLFSLPFDVLSTERGDGFIQSASRGYIPNPINVAVLNTNPTLQSVGYGLDIERAVFLSRWEGPAGSNIALEQRSFFHRTIRSLQVNQFVLKNGSPSPVRET